jgi:peptidoglycan-associated lipoprotein
MRASVNIVAPVSFSFRGLHMTNDLARSLTLLALVIAATLTAAPSATAQSLDVGLGYTYVHSNLPPGGCGCFSLNGGNAWAGLAVTSHLAIVGEVAIQHASNIASTSGDLTLTSYLFGPRYTVRATRRFHPFVQVLLGGAHASGSEAPGANGLPGSANAFAATVGGGLNLAFTDHISLRLIQADYYMTRFNNGLNDHQNNLRLGAGIVFRFGNK